MAEPTLHRGKLAKHPTVLTVRPLTREDLARIRPSEGRVVTRVKSFRDTHHRLARLVASGMRTDEILSLTGYSAARLSTLKQDPAFGEIVAHYRGKVDESWVSALDEFHASSVSNMLRAERQIEAHLDNADDTEELLPVRTLLAITSDRADRFGYGKHRTETKVDLTFAKQMEDMMARSGRGSVIDAKALSPPGVDLAPSGEEVSITPSSSPHPVSVVRRR